MELLPINPQTTNPNKNKNKVITKSIIMIIPYQIITTTLLTLLLPLSFLLLSRLSTANFLLSVSSENYVLNPKSLFCAFLLFTKNPTILHLSLSLITVSSLTYAITGKFPYLNNIPKRLSRPRLFVAWILLFVLQTCVFFGIEGSHAAGIDGSSFGQDLSDGWFSRTVFFFGLHETMVFWGLVVVKPVVDDTVFGHSRAGSWFEKAVLGFGYGGLWWWRLRDEVEALVVVPVVKRELMMSIGVADFLGWWLYYLTVAIGVVRLVKGVIWTVWIVTRRRVVDVEVNRSNDEKV